MTGFNAWIAPRLLRLALVLTPLSALLLVIALLLGPLVPTGWRLAYLVQSRPGGQWTLHIQDMERRLAQRVTFAGTSIMVNARLEPGGDWLVANYGDGLDLWGTANGTPVGEARFLRDAQLAQWSPTGARLAFTSQDQLYVARVDENGLVGPPPPAPLQVSGIGADARYLNPVWSPDGSALAVSVAQPDRTPEGIAVRYDLAVVRFTQGGTGSITVLTETPGVDEFDAAWSPDGTRLAYIAGSARDERDVYTIAADGSEAPRRVSPVTLEYRHPLWSPDGTWFIYLGYQGTGDWGIFRLPADDLDERALLLSTSASESVPVWSPDSTWLAYVRVRDRDIYLVSYDGRALQRITDNDSFNVLLP